MYTAAEQTEAKPVCVMISMLLAGWGTEINAHRTGERQREIGGNAISLQRTCIQLLHHEPSAMIIDMLSPTQTWTRATTARDMFTRRHSKVALVKKKSYKNKKRVAFLGFLWSYLIAEGFDLQWNNGVSVKPNSLPLQLWSPTSQVSGGCLGFTEEDQTWGMEGGKNTPFTALTRRSHFTYCIHVTSLYISWHYNPSVTRKRGRLWSQQILAKRLQPFTFICLPFLNVFFLSNKIETYAKPICERTFSPQPTFGMFFSLTMINAKPICERTFSLPHTNTECLHIQSMRLAKGSYGSSSCKPTEDFKLQKVNDNASLKDVIMR